MLRKGAAFQGPMLVAHGDCDQFASLSQVEGILSEFKGQQERQGQPPKLVPCQGCDHFFHGSQQEIAKLFSDWVSSTDFP